MKLFSLASGSSGNCYLVQSSAGHNILIDCGLSAKKVQQYLAGFGVQIHQLSAIFLTHDHSDHVSGVGTISQRWGVVVYANSKTLEAARLRWEKLHRVAVEQTDRSGAADSGTVRPPAISKYNLQVLPTGAVIWFGSLQVSSFPVSHDAADTVCYTLRENECQATILTDLGCATNVIFEPLCRSDLIILEANHSLERLQKSRYPYYLKARITSDHGHLSNLQSGKILQEIIERSSPAHLVWLAHLSQESNQPEIAKHEISHQLEMAGIHKFPLHVAQRDKPSLQWNGEPAVYQIPMF
ncbi:MAG: MBL fold metallo-hydrolase [Chloroflexota bacterium]|nr:MBL fold metallo-hydrolase [Chloroflexota bacterium]